MSLSVDTPQPQNPGITANQQQKLNTTSAEQTQAGSMVEQDTPFGSLSYQKTGTGPGGIPLYKATTQLTQPEQNLFNQLIQTQTESGKAALPFIKNYAGNTDPTKAIGSATSGLTQEMLRNEVGYLQPYFDRQNATKKAELESSGILPGSQAYKNAFADLANSQNNSVTGFLAQAQPQAFSEASSLYTLPATLGSSLAAFGQPGSVNTSLVQTPQLSVNPANYEGDVSSYNQAAQQAAATQAGYTSNMVNALMSPVSAFAGGWGRSISDRRLKKNVYQVGKLENGLPVYRFTFSWEHEVQHIGLMADEVEKVHPEAVSEIGGFKVVDYDLAVR